MAYFSLGILFLLIPFVAASVCNSGCQRTFKKLGCFAFQEETTPNLLITDLVANEFTSSGILIDQSKDLEASILSLLCRCLTKTKAMGYTIFGLTNRGQCHAGNQETKLNKLAKDGRFAPPLACSNTNKGLCNVLNETENCFGKDMHSFYYQVMKTVDGQWGSWSLFTKCNTTCGKAFKTRQRSCDQPKPLYGGKMCQGPSVEVQECHLGGCPRDGGYTSWSTFSSCTLSCGGGVQSRTRSCTQPPPLNGGKKCSGPSSETKACNTQPCPAPWTCQQKTTQWDVDGNGDARYFDRHQLKCPSATAINLLRLERDSTLTKYRFVYKCCSIGATACNSTKLTRNSFSYDGTGSARYLDRQYVECNKHLISSLRLETNLLNFQGDKIRYVYNCCQAPNQHRTCYSAMTKFSDDGGGSAIYLDRQKIECNREFSLSAFRLVRDTNTMKHWSYKYTCCKTTPKSLVKTVV
eukprot:TCONS_00073484-protein